MNVYFLVEGKATERRIYPAWLSHLLPKLQRVNNYDLVRENNYYLISGGGYPCIIDRQIPDSIEEIKEIGIYNYFVICIDAEENTITEIQSEVYEVLRNKKLNLVNTEIILIVQNRCIETWFLGNRRIYLRQPQSEPLLSYTRYYNISENDPELMSTYQGFSTNAQFHHAYLREIFKARNITYTKNNPGEVTELYYLQQLLDRINDQPSHLNTFRHFINFCDMLKTKL
jgi:hypothetical protein